MVTMGELVGASSRVRDRLGRPVTGGAPSRKRCLGQLRA